MLREVVLRSAYTLLRARQVTGRDRALSLWESGTGAPILTSVFRLPPATATNIVAAVRGLPGIEQQYLYPVEDIHLTVLNLDRLAGGATRERIEQLREVLAASEPFSVEVRGVGMSAQSIYAQVIDVNGALRALRARLASVAGVRPPLALRYLGFVNVVRFRSSDGHLLRQGVKALRGSRFGAVEVATVEIVQTDKVLSGSGTVRLATARLGPPRLGPGRLGPRRLGG